MATSGKINGTAKYNSSASSLYSFWADWTRNSYSVENNTSNITVSLKLQRIDGSTAGAYNLDRYPTVTLKVNGTQQTPTISYIDTRKQVVCIFATWTGNVTHNSDGTLTCPIVASFTMSGSSTLSSGDISGNVTLDTIPRASSLSLSASSVNVGSSITANITRAVSSFTHTVEFYINSTYYQKYTSVATSQAFTIPTTWYNAIPSSTSCTAYCRITTYSGSTQIGSQVSKTFTVSVPSSVVPSVGTITLTPANITTSDGTSRTILVKGKNKLTISVSGCAAGTGSSIKSYTFSGPGISSTTTSTSVTSSSSMSSTGTLTYTVKVTDKRGRTASKTATISCYDYANPSFTSFNAYRVGSSSSTTANDSGTYVRCSYGLSYSSVNSTNHVDVKIFYKKNTASSWSSTTVVTDSTSTSGNKTLSSIDASSTYTIYAQITDNYGATISSTPITIFGASRIMNIRPNGTGVAFGKMAETDNLFESKWPAKFNDDVELNGDSEFNGNVTFNGEIYGLPEQEKYVLPTASTSTLGGVKVDGSTVTISNGTISAKQYSLPTASTSALGGVKVDGSSITISSGVISAKQQSSISAIFNNSSSTSSSCSFTPSSYNLIICGLTPSASGTVIFTTLPAALASSGVTFQVADEVNYCKWTLSSTGLTRSTGAGYIKYIYGVKL